MKPIIIKKKNRGGLHRDLGVKQGKKLTAKQIAVKPGDSEKLRKRKQFAINARKWSHRGGLMS